jgi:hypothetical protein
MQNISGGDYSNFIGAISNADGLTRDSGDRP